MLESQRQHRVSQLLLLLGVADELGQKGGGLGGESLLHLSIALCQRFDMLATSCCFGLKELILPYLMKLNC